MPEPMQQPVQASFEAGLDELERVVKEMESGDLPLERSLELFEKGMALSEACRKQLEEAETRVEKLLDRGNRVDVEPASFK
ncbi:MAG TPA: exodeoxyribonuclease VII small subunit [Bryobacteraceae bacterium]